MSLLRTRIFSYVITENDGNLTLMQKQLSNLQYVFIFVNCPKYAFTTFLACLYFATQEPLQGNALGGYASFISFNLK